MTESKEKTHKRLNIDFSLNIGTFIHLVVLIGTIIGVYMRLEGRLTKLEIQGESIPSLARSLDELKLEQKRITTIIDKKL